MLMVYHCSQFANPLMSRHYAECKYIRLTHWYEVGPQQMFLLLFNKILTL